MLQDVSGAQVAAARVADGAMECDTVLLGVVDTAVQDVVVVEGNVSRLELDNQLIGEDFLEGAGVALGVSASTLVRARDEDKRVILVQGKVVLGVETRAAESLHLLVGGGLGGDVVTVPAELKVTVGADEHVEQLHDELLVVTLQKLLDDAEHLLGEVQLREELVARHVGLHHVLHTPDALLGVKLPGRELLAYCADVRPVAGAGELLDLETGFAESGELLGSDDGLDDDEAITLEVGEIGRGFLGRHFV